MKEEEFLYRRHRRKRLSGDRLLMRWFLFLFWGAVGLLLIYWSFK